MDIKKQESTIPLLRQSLAQLGAEPTTKEGSNGTPPIMRSRAESMDAANLDVTSAMRSS